MRLNDLLQDKRDRLRKKLDRVGDSNLNTLPHKVADFWSYIQSDPILKEFCDGFLEVANKTDAETVVRKLLNLTTADVNSGPIVKIGENNVPLICYLLKTWVDRSSRLGLIEKILRGYLAGQFDIDTMSRDFTDLILYPLVEALEVSINRVSYIGFILQQYKRKWECFTPDEKIQELAEELEGKRKEEWLSFSLYEYLNDYGIELQLKPKTSIGSEADFLARYELSKDSLLAECKYFNGDSHKENNVFAGVKQILKYALDNNVSEGYVIVFANSEKMLRLDLEMHPLGFSTYLRQNIAVHMIVVDIFRGAATSSRVGSQVVIDKNWLDKKFQDQQTTD